jgi:hypothetical protein
MGLRLERLERLERLQALGEAPLATEVVATPMEMP